MIDTAKCFVRRIFNRERKAKTMSTNDAIELALTQLASAIEVGKSIARVQIAIDINAAEYLLGLSKATNSAIVDKDGEPTEAFKNAEDLQVEIDVLNEDNEGHIARVAKRDGTILELQDQIKENTEAHKKGLITAQKHIDDVIAENKEQAAIIDKAGLTKDGKKKGK